MMRSYTSLTVLALAAYTALSAPIRLGNLLVEFEGHS
jgi:hypothetical protein